LETELAKAREAESSLRLEFDRQLAEERKILSAEYDGKVNELRATLGSKVESRGAQIDELQTLRGLDSKRYDKEIGIWRAHDRKVQSGLLGLEEALRGTSFPVSQLLPFHAAPSLSDCPCRSFP
jgi:hypothetical protein